MLSLVWATVAILLILMCNITVVSAQLQDENKKVLWVEVNGFISSATAENVADAIRFVSSTNNQKQYSAIILALDTPGGSMEATLDIIESIQSSTVPIITYVFPEGTSAWSAGTIILLAGDYAAMSPVTTIGSAQPVLGIEPINDTKIINALKEKVISLSELHHRNATQAARFITDNDNLTPEKALSRNVIESIASDPEELLSKADNFTVTTYKGAKVLHLSNSEIEKHSPSLRVVLVSFLSNPLIATVFLTIGFFAIIYGLTSPGFGAEIVGAILIILGLVGQGFDINWAAFALLAIGAGLIAYELYSPGFGAMGIGGIIVLSIGSVLMITQPIRPLLIQEEHLGTLAMSSALIILPFGVLMGFVTYKVWRSKKQSKVDFMLQSSEGIALDTISRNKQGFVLIGGEYWKARTNKSNIRKGDRVKILSKDGHVLTVERIQ